MDIYIHMKKGLFKNERVLFGWLAIKLFMYDEEDRKFKIRCGTYIENLLDPPG
jgi:hypothetical protein